MVAEGPDSEDSDGDHECQNYKWHLFGDAAAVERQLSPAAVRNPDSNGSEEPLAES